MKKASNEEEFEVMEDLPPNISRFRHTDKSKLSFTNPSFVCDSDSSEKEKNKNSARKTKSFVALPSAHKHRYAIQLL